MEGSGDYNWQLKTRMLLIRESSTRSWFHEYRIADGSRSPGHIFPGQDFYCRENAILGYAARFIGKYGCDGYFRNNKNLLFYERKIEILQQIKDLNLDE